MPLDVSGRPSVAMYIYSSFGESKICPVNKESTPRPTEVVKFVFDRKTLGLGPRRYTNGFVSS